MHESVVQLLKFIDPIIKQNILGLRLVGLKFFSSLINHCRGTKQVDDSIKKTRKGLQSLAMDYITKLVNLYTADSTEDANQDNKAMQGDDVFDHKSAAKVRDKEASSKNYQVLLTLQDFASIAKAGKLSNLFLSSFAELVDQKEMWAGEDYIPTSDMNLILKNFDVLIAIMDQVKLKKDNQIVLMQGIKAFINDFKTKKKAYKLLAKIVEKYELENGISELVQIHQELTPLIEGQTTKQRLRLIKAYVE